jgi:crossover junction endodeoxyribonuclease RuvC
MIIFGIDPGQTGAIAVLHDGEVKQVIDMPTTARLHGKGQQVDAYTLTSELLAAASGHNQRLAIIEAVSAMPGQGVSSTFRFGEALGVVLGVLGALQIPVSWASPVRWKKAAGLYGKDKDAARTLALQLHPEAGDMLTRKKDIGRADAICIAHFGSLN